MQSVSQLAHITIPRRHMKTGEQWIGAIVCLKSWDFFSERGYKQLASCPSAEQFNHMRRSLKMEPQRESRWEHCSCMGGQHPECYHNRMMVWCHGSESSHIPNPPILTQKVEYSSAVGFVQVAWVADLDGNAMAPLQIILGEERKGCMRNQQVVKQAHVEVCIRVKDPNRA